jgi:hypothetical protein
VCVLLGQRAGYTKHHVSYVNGTAEQAVNTGSTYTGQTLRTSPEPGSNSILGKGLVNPKKTPLPPIHIELRIMKQFVKALPKTVNCFRYLCTKIAHLTTAN